MEDKLQKLAKGKNAFVHIFPLESRDHTKKIRELPLVTVADDDDNVLLAKLSVTMDDLKHLSHNEENSKAFDALSYIYINKLYDGQ